ncbi:MAG: DUF551 domain-containing protein [Christensenella sp.]|uniref:DUF551 domain-containing protein n=1 Tax=Christensenella sp. TaxID=1935934 RepID=UPI002B1FF59F|nr:DUF551 domain-containing protein [Christensenella sp.]MEA5003834.1 DUF551 domain-containing protein [Christensenella sp.]
MNDDVISRNELREKAMECGKLAQQDPRLLVVGLGYVVNAPTVYQWISVRDGLPETDGNYLVAYTLGIDQYWMEVSGFCKNGKDVCEYGLAGAKNTFYGYDDEYGYYPINYVAHWMPLPEPPKEDAE